MVGEAARTAGVLPGLDIAHARPHIPLRGRMARARVTAAANG
ncbi:hypothetical protein FHS82_001127 [Pseudochelatococcus lubricantis]|uniref:Uncharacterized protein n=1 Tax=Pseudochelatococcus lubricantis TaxID=1538102 RepID=A0ABX0UWG8_9HYPH|nr:hypothetical protein [Pseudochelatococcus lubricantis]NIJ57301.1 hypothetical protein [Pseudochelatococcus lubricantis]